MAQHFKKHFIDAHLDSTCEAYTVEYRRKYENNSTDPSILDHPEGAKAYILHTWTTVYARLRHIDELLRVIELRVNTDSFGSIRGDGVMKTARGRGSAEGETGDHGSTHGVEVKKVRR